jgi:hypothetical protein
LIPLPALRLGYLIRDIKADRPRDILAAGLIGKDAGVFSLVAGIKYARGFVNAVLVVFAYKDGREQRAPAALGFVERSNSFKKLGR